jgi:hypothetical protein
VKTATNRRLLISESHGDLNWCTPCKGKPSQHTTLFPCSVCIWPSTIRISRGSRIANFCESSIDLDGSHCSWKKGSWHNSQHAGWPIRGSVPSFPPKPTNEAVGLSQASVDEKLLGLLGPYHQHVIGTFNAYSQGLTHRSLTDTGGGYNLGGADFLHTTPCPAQPAIPLPPFHLRAPPGLQLNHKPLIKPKFKESTATPWSSDHSAIYGGLHLCLAIANDLSLAIGFTRIDWKVILMQLGYQFNFYNLMHIQVS